MIVPPFSINILILSIPEFSAGNNPFCQAVSAKLHKYTAEFTDSEHKSPKSLLRKARKRGKIYSGNTADMAIRNRQSYKGG
nr:hypothetical protein [Butyricicoccus sp. OF30-11pH9A]